MDAERNREALTDPSLGRDLQALLAIEPSPEFVARVRTRVASEPEPRARWLSWTFAGVVAAAAAVVVIAVYLAGPREIASLAQMARHAQEGPAAATPNVQARPHTQPTVAPDLSGTVSQATSRQMASSQRVTGERAGSQPASIQPASNHLLSAEVVLDPRETAALRALIRGAADGRVDLAPVLQASTPTAMDLPPITEIAIPPIVITPLAEEGVRQ